MVGSGGNRRGGRMTERAVAEEPGPADAAAWPPPVGAAAGTGGLAGASGLGGAGGTGRAGTGGSNPTGGSGGLSGTGGATSSGGGTGSDTATIVPDPSWACWLPDGIPPPTAGTLAFSVALTVSANHDVGNTQFGHRRQLDVTGGTITGERLKGTVLTGGLDYELTFSTGAMELRVDHLEDERRVTIFARICGVATTGIRGSHHPPHRGPDLGLVRLAQHHQAGRHARGDAAGGKITLDVYDVSNVTVGDPKVQLKDPAGVPNVSWNCVTASGSNGATVFTENVTLGRPSPSTMPSTEAATSSPSPGERRPAK